MEKSSQEIGLYGHHQQKSYFASLTVMKGSNIVKHESMLTVPRLGITDNWRKLYDKKNSHERNIAHCKLYCEWKSLENNLKTYSGIGSSLQLKIETKVSMWRQILSCILDVTLFLSERSFSFHGISHKVGDPDNGRFWCFGTAWKAQQNT